MAADLPLPARQQAALLRLAYAMGLARYADVIAWVDAAILMVGNVPKELTNLALAEASRPKMIFGLLGQLARNFDGKLADQQALGVLRERFRSGQLGTDAASHALQTFKEVGNTDLAQHGLLYSLDSEYELGLMGYPLSTDMVAEAVSDFLDANRDDSYDPALFARIEPDTPVSAARQSAG